MPLSQPHIFIHVVVSSHISLHLSTSTCLSYSHLIIFVLFANDVCISVHMFAKRALVAGSIGPYGACLEDGSEYDGSYMSMV